MNSLLRSPLRRMAIICASSRRVSSYENAARYYRNDDILRSLGIGIGRFRWSGDTVNNLSSAGSHRTD